MHRKQLQQQLKQHQQQQQDAVEAFHRAPRQAAALLEQTMNCCCMYLALTGQQKGPILTLAAARIPSCRSNRASSNSRTMCIIRSFCSNAPCWPSAWPTRFSGFVHCFCSSSGSSNSVAAFTLKTQHQQQQEGRPSLRTLRLTSPSSVAVVRPACCFVDSFLFVYEVQFSLSSSISSEQ